MQKIIVAFTIGILFVLSGCGGTQEADQIVPDTSDVEQTETMVEGTVDSNVVENTLTIEDILSDEEMLEELLSKEPEISDCDVLQNPQDKRVCRVNLITQKAIEASDASMCDQLESEEDQARCKRKVSN